MGFPSAAVTQAEVWIISGTAAAGSDFLDGMAGVNQNWPYPVAFESVSLADNDTGSHNSQRLVSDVRVGAAVLVLDPECISMSECERWVYACIQAVARRDDFRLFVHLQKMTRDDLVTAATQRADLSYLLDTVQIPAALDATTTRDHLTRYLTQLPDSRNAAVWRQLSRRTSITLGWIAEVTQGLAAAIAGLMLAIELIGGRARLIGWIPAGGHVPLAVTVGLPVAAALAVMAFQFSQLFGPGSNAMGKLMLAFLFAALPFEMISVLHLAPGWVALGIAAGILLDVFRRRGYQARLAQADANGRDSTPSGHELPTDLQEALVGRPPDPLRYPILPQEEPRVFVSYTRQPSWGAGIARPLFDRLRAAGIRNSFLDAHGIQPGSDWRKTLNRALGDANVFISLADQASVLRGWPAAELESALRRQRLSGLPQIIVLVDPQLAADQHVAPQAAYAGILRLLQEAPSPDRPRVISVKDSTLDTVVQGLQFPNFRSRAGLPEGLGQLVRLVANRLSLIMSAVGTSGLLVGWLAAGLAALQILGNLNTAAWLAPRGLLAPAMVLCGFWLGYLARLAVYARFELRHANSRSVFAQHAVAVAGLFVLAMLWLPVVPVVAAAWSAVLAGTAWVAAGSFLFYVGTQKPELKRPQIGE